MASTPGIYSRQRGILGRITALERRLHSAEARVGLDIEQNRAVSTPKSTQNASAAPPARVTPARRVVKHFVNLTDGLEVAGELVRTIGVPLGELGFVRVQSTHCEADDFEAVLANLDANFLLHLCLGHVCLVYDLGSRGLQWPGGVEGVPRAIWWGLEWARYALSRFWGLETGAYASLRGMDVTPLFERWRLRLSKRVKARLRYYKLHLRTDRLHLYGVYRRTEHDGSREFYRDHLWKLFPDQTEIPQIRTAGQCNGNDFDQKGNDDDDDDDDDDGIDRRVFVKSLGVQFPKGMRLFLAEDFQGDRWIGPSD